MPHLLPKQHVAVCLSEGLQKGLVVKMDIALAVGQRDRRGHCVKIALHLLLRRLQLHTAHVILQHASNVPRGLHQKVHDNRRLALEHAGLFRRNQHRDCADTRTVDQNRRAEDAVDLALVIVWA